MECFDVVIVALLHIIGGLFLMLVRVQPSTLCFKGRKCQSQQLQGEQSISK